MGDAVNAVTEGPGSQNNHTPASWELSNRLKSDIENDNRVSFINDLMDMAKQGVALDTLRQAGFSVTQGFPVTIRDTMHTNISATIPFHINWQGSESETTNGAQVSIDTELPRNGVPVITVNASIQDWEDW